MKLSLFKKVFVAGLIGASLSAVAHAQDLLDSVKQRGTLRIGLEGTFPPFNSKTPQGELVDFDVDIAKAVAAKLGVGLGTNYIDMAKAVPGIDVTKPAK